MKSIAEIFADPLAFISRLKIKTKSGKLIRFKPNAEQIRIIQGLHAGDSLVIFKSRQIGSSTACAAYSFWLWYTAKDPISLVMLSHKLASSKHIFEMQKTFYDSLPKKLQRPLSVSNTTTLTLADTKASLQAMSAQGDGGLRSFTCSFLHLSEWAFADDPEELLSTAISALNDGQLVMESTAKAFGDSLHTEILKIQQGKSEYKLIDFYWWQHAEYSQEAPSGYIPAEDELELQDKFGLTKNQLYWRHVMIKKLGHEKFKREYPADINDAFAQTGNAYYTESDLRYLDVIRIDPAETTTFFPYDKTDSYAIGCDVASGVGQDYSVAIVLSKNTYRPVAIYRSNTVNPIMFARQIFHLSNSYGEAKVLIESNNWGLPVINELRNMGFLKFWKDQEGKDWLTTTKSKLSMHEELKSAISEGIIQSIDSITAGELRSLVLNDSGLAPTVPDNLPHHGDCVIALGLAFQCIKSVQKKTTAILPEWIRNERSKRISSTTFGIPNNRG